MKQACVENNEIILKIMLRIKNPDTVFGEMNIREETQMLIDEDDFIFISIKKIYVLHQGEKKGSHTSCAMHPNKALLYVMFSISLGIVIHFRECFSQERMLKIMLDFIIKLQKIL